MRLFVLAGLAALLLSGCGGDCQVGEATGLLSAFAGRCGATGYFDEDDGTLQVNISAYGDQADENLYRNIEFSGKPPFFVGKHQTSRVFVTPLGAILYDGELPAEGQVDFVIDGADFSKSGERKMFITIVKLEARDRVTSKLGTFRGAVTLLKTGK